MGYIDLDQAFSYHGQQLSTSRSGKKSILKVEPVNHFAAEMEHFSECILNDRDPRTPGEEGLADMKIMAAILESAASGRIQKV